MRSEDSSTGESEEEEEAGWKYVVKYTLLSPPLSCKHPTTVLVATYSSCTLHLYIRMVFAKHNTPS